jgi:hypothetical protein
MTHSSHGIRPVLAGASRLLICAAVLLAGQGCALKKIALNSVANALGQRRHLLLG